MGDVDLNSVVMPHEAQGPETFTFLNVIKGLDIIVICFKNRRS